MKRKRLSNVQRITGISIVLVIIVYIGLRFYWGDISILHSFYEPFGNTVNYLKTTVGQPFEYVTSVSKLTKENNALKKQLDQYNLLMQNYEELAEDNKRLKKLLNVKNIDPFIKKVAVVIGKTPDIWHQEIIIDLGKKDGIEINTIIISNFGLVGKVKSVTDSTSVVQLITDSSNWVSTQNNRSRAIGMLKVDDNKVGKLSYLVNKSDFKNNDLIITSGLGGVYPKGIPVGIIDRIKKRSGDDIPEIDVSLLTDFDNLEEVIALVKK